MIKIDRELCTGCGVCYSMRPDVFGQEEDGKALVIRSGDTDESIADVIDACPASAIEQE